MSAIAAQQSQSTGIIFGKEAPPHLKPAQMPAQIIMATLPMMRRISTWSVATWTIMSKNWTTMHAIRRLTATFPNMVRRSVWRILINREGLQGCKRSSFTHMESHETTIDIAARSCKAYHRAACLLVGCRSNKASAPSGTGTGELDQGLPA